MSHSAQKKARVQHNSWVPPIGSPPTFGGVCESRPCCLEYLPSQHGVAVSVSLTFNLVADFLKGAQGSRIVAGDNAIDTIGSFPLESESCQSTDHVRAQSHPPEVFLVDHQIDPSAVLLWMPLQRRVEPSVACRSSDLLFPSWTIDSGGAK